MERKSTRDKFPLRLLINGQDFTFLADEDFSYSNTDPGGFESAQFPIPKDLPEVQRGQLARLECGLGVAWEGRVEEVQRSLGNKTLVQCKGEVTRLKDALLSMVFIDRDLSRWVAPGVAWRRVMAENNYQEGSQSIGFVEADRAAIVQQVTDSWVSPYRPYVDSVYDAGPENLIADLIVGLHTIRGLEGLDAAWERYAYAFAGLNGAASQQSANLNAFQTRYEQTLSPQTRCLLLRSLYPNTPYGAQGAEFLAYWIDAAVIGNHGLTLRGTWPSTLGLYTSDIATWITEQVSAIGSRGLDVGVIGEASAYTLPHLAYYTPTEAERMLQDIVKFVGWHWGVWEPLHPLTGSQNPRLDFRPYPTAPTAYCWRSECEDLDIRENLEGLYDSAAVTFTEPGGDEGCVIVSVGNPLMPAGIHRRASLSAGTSTAAAAEAYGVTALETMLAQEPVLGSAVIREPIHDVLGAEIPAWMLKSGIDLLRVVDLPSSGVWGEHNNLPVSRVECSGGEDGLTTNVEFGSGLNLLEALNAQFAEAAAVAG